MTKRRVLVIDDSEDVHKDFALSLCPGPPEGNEELTKLEEALFGEVPARQSASGESFELDSAYQGQGGLAKVREAIAAGRPYSLVFMDYRMPPGWAEGTS